MDVFSKGKVKKKIHFCRAYWKKQQSSILIWRQEGDERTPNPSPPPPPHPPPPLTSRKRLLAGQRCLSERQKMAGRVPDVLDVCPQLVPQDRTKRFYDGYITVCVSYYCVNK